MKKLRYTVNISFVFPQYSNIVEPVASLNEAMQYKGMLDDTVKDAVIIDNINQRVVVWLKKNENRKN